MEKLLPEGAPSCVAGESALFFRGRLPAFFSDRVKQINSGAVLVEPGDLPPADDLQRVVDMEVAGAGVGRTNVLGVLYSLSFSGSSIR